MSAVNSKVPHRLLFISFGTRGDIEPCVALARGFKARGYAVWICSTDEHRGLVAENGIEFVSAAAGCTIDGLYSESELDDHSPEILYKVFARFFERHGAEFFTGISGFCRTNSVECVMLGSCVFFQKFVGEQLKLPSVNLSLSPLNAGAPAAQAAQEAIRAYAHNFVRHVNYSKNFGIERAIERACKAGGFDVPDSNSGFSDLKKTLTLQGFSKALGNQCVPGLAWRPTGFWHLEAPVMVDGKTAALLKYLAEGETPICLNFGSMDVYRPGLFPWIDKLLSEIRSSGQRCLAIGNKVPHSIREWAYWVASAPHSLVFPKCACVIHHGGAGTTASCLRSGVPALIVPILKWADQEVWGEWVARERAGLCVSNPEAGFDGMLREIQKPIYRESALRLRDVLKNENGIENAIREFESDFIAGLDRRETDVNAMKHLDRLKAAPVRKLMSSLYVLLRDERELPRQTLKHRDEMMDALVSNTRKYPAFRDDWPKKGEPIDLARHDLPHASALLEWWYFHAHLKSETDGRVFSMFSAVFQRLFNGTRLSYGHGAMLDAAQRRHFIRSKGDPRAPGVITPIFERAGRSEFIQRALGELFAKNSLPAPDRLGIAPFEIPDTELNFRLDELRMTKRADGSYDVALEQDSEFGFKLNFRPLKGVVLNGENGVVFQGSSEDSMYYYSITRLAVTGIVFIGSECIPVSGSGWFDHEFGGEPERDYEELSQIDRRWLWMALQLEDGSELNYNIVEVKSKSGDKISYVEYCLIIDPDGECSYHKPKIESHSQWASMRTFLEYETAWTLEVESLGLSLEIEAEIPNQEFISVIADPAYWEGRVRVVGKRGGASISGVGFVEQVGACGSTNDYKQFLNHVSKLVRQCVERVYPMQPSPEFMRRMIADPEFHDALDGIDAESFAKTIIHPMRYIIDRGGKAWRSMAIMLCAGAVGGDPDSIADCLAYPELLHTASLIIDDIQDNSDVRRGGPACHVQFGVATSINSASAAYFMAESVLNNLNLSAMQRARVYHLYFNCLRGAHTGQAMDIYGLRHLVVSCAETGDFSSLWKRIFAIHRLKSGLPASISARFGVVLGNGTRAQEDVLGAYFLALGLAFQIMDDVINLRGFSGLKNRAEDLHEGKITTPVVRALNVLEAEDRSALCRHMGLIGDVRDVERAIRLIDKCGALDWCVEYSSQLVENAWQAVDRELPDSFSKIMLRAFGWFVVHVRDY